VTNASIRSSHEFSSQPLPTTHVSLIVLRTYLFISLVDFAQNAEAAQEGWMQWGKSKGKGTNLRALGAGQQRRLKLEHETG
jgi:hypothetical protein